MSRSSPKLARSRESGVGLIEVLIAVLVLCLGMLGLAGLQLFSLRSNQSAHERGMAVVQTHSIVDAMRADRDAAINGAFNIGIDSATPTGTSFANVAVSTWRGNITAALGDGATGGIACNGTLCTISVRWDDSRAGGSNAQVVTTQVQL